MNIIKTARDAGFIVGDQFSAAGDEASLERFAALVAEECAKLCDEMVDVEYKTGKVDHNEIAWTQACSIAIRAKFKTPN